MKNRSIVFESLLICLLVPSFSARLFSDEFDFVYLGGQSNMEGFGYVSEIADKVPGVVPNAFIFHSSASLDRQPVGGSGQWMPLQPGHGVGFISDGKSNTYSDRFGVELSLATELQRLRPGRKLAIIKYARNGSSIHQGAAADWGCWEPDFQANEGQYRNVKSV